MKKTLGLMGTLVCSAGLLALPAAARDRSDNGNGHGQARTEDARSYGSGYDNRYLGDRGFGDSHGRHDYRTAYLHSRRHERDFHARRNFGWGVSFDWR